MQSTFTTTKPVPFLYQIKNMKSLTYLTIILKQNPHRLFSFEERKQITPFLREIEAFEIQDYLFESHKTVQEIEKIIEKYDFFYKKD